MRCLCDQKRRRQIGVDNPLPLFARHRGQWPRAGTACKVNDVIEAPPISEYAFDTTRDRRLIGDVHAHHADRRAAGNISQRTISGENPHTAFA